MSAWPEITTVDELVALIGVPLPRVANKARTALHELDRQWLAASPFCLVATSDASGELRRVAEGGSAWTAGARHRRDHHRAGRAARGIAASTATGTCSPTRMSG